MAGMVIGLGISLALSRFMTSLLYGVSATDPLTFGAVPLVLIAVAILAIAPAAIRAARLEPMSALRDE
jgi:ABC-type antimicrobial peptide transport system permease subunit